MAEPPDVSLETRLLDPVRLWNGLPETGLFRHCCQQLRTKPTKLLHAKGLHGVDSRGLLRRDDAGKEGTDPQGKD